MIWPVSVQANPPVKPKNLTYVRKAEVKPTMPRTSTKHLDFLQKNPTPTCIGNKESNNPEFLDFRHILKFVIDMTYKQNTLLWVAEN